MDLNRCLNFAASCSESIFLSYAFINITSECLDLTSSTYLYKIKMIKPLVLKSKENISLQTNKIQLLTVNDLISRFNIKSPTSQICLTDRSSTSTRSLSSSNNNNFFKRKSFNRPESNKKQQCAGFRKVKMTTNANKKPILQLQKMSFKQKQQKDSQTKSEKKISLNLQFLKNKEDKSLVSKVVREMKSTIKVGKENNLELAKKTTKIAKMKLQRPLTDRSQQKTNAFSQIIVKKEIFQSNNSKIGKSHQREQNVHEFDIKMSNASTLSLKTKHTTSLQNFEEYQELFTKQEYKNQKQPEKGIQSNYPTLTQLQKVKQKIYNQIYSLDKKLLAQDIHQKSKKQITISLKRKDKIFHQRQESDLYLETK